ncbi:MAG: carboxypeptidase-like regulatory domain-containing protein [Saprospiraceae bacterium]|nr:carboxypeptidase-like regulatory domain-containing protein [Saprospiraceae bacterium]
MINRFAQLLFACILCLFETTAFAQANQVTSIHGRVTDSLSGAPLPYASVQVEGEELGARTDIDGFFFFQSKGTPKFIKISYVGYKTLTFKVEAHVHNEFQIQLVEETYGIQEVTIKPKKYRKKDNPAVDLIEEVFKHKDQNRKEGLEYYSFEKYEKLQFDLNSIDKKFKKKWYLRKFQFIFNHLDTNKVNGKVALPFYLRERLIDVYYRNNPFDKREYLLGEQQTSLRKDYDVDSDGISKFLSNLYQDVDIYEPNISLLSLQFMGPLSSVAPTFYRFYITDTLEVGGEKFADVFFAPKNKNDLAFMGNMLVALDSTYAVRKVVMGISKQINLNWVTDLRIEQEYAFFGEGNKRRLLLTTDAVTMDFNILKNSGGRSLLTKKTNSYRNYKLNEPIEDARFPIGSPYLIKADQLLSATDWPAHRHSPLTNQEWNIGQMMDSIQEVPAFKRFMFASTLAASGFIKFGWFELGPVSTFTSFNDIEGNRFRLGGRTNIKLLEPLFISAYAAYGLKDEQWKWNGSITWSFNNRMPRMFPMNNLTAGYQRDIRALGVDVTNWSPDNIFLSFQRGSNSRMVYQRVGRLEYAKEHRGGFSFFPSIYWKEFTPAGKLRFEYQLAGDSVIVPKANLTTSEVGVILRYAPNEKFYQGTVYRFAMLTKYPVFTVTYKAGIKGVWGSEYNYHKVTANFFKNFFLGPIGRSQLTLEAGRTFGRVPFPLLDIHRANQSYQFDWYSYNLMNFMEFASDKYFAMTLHHNFSGFFLNKIPVIKRLKWREVGSLKMLWGGLDKENRPSASNGLFLFPTDDSGADYIHTLDRRPYMEASVGIANIFKMLRIDYLWRLSYTDLPNVDTWGIRFSVQSGF